MYLLVLIVKGKRQAMRLCGTEEAKEEEIEKLQEMGYEKYDKFKIVINEIDVTKGVTLKYG